VNGVTERLLEGLECLGAAAGELGGRVSFRDKAVAWRWEGKLSKGLLVVMII
jgi:hypothetical protein